MNIDVKYEHKPYDRCHGTWFVSIDGIDVSDKIPEDIRVGNMETENNYSYFYYNEDEKDPIRAEYNKRGLDESEWIKKNDYWLNDITTNMEIKQEIYREIQMKNITGCGDCMGCGNYHRKETI